MAMIVFDVKDRMFEVKRELGVRDYLHEWRDPVTKEPHPLPHNALWKRDASEDEALRDLQLVASREGATIVAAIALPHGRWEFVPSRETS